MQVEPLRTEVLEYSTVWTVPSNDNDNIISITQNQGVEASSARDNRTGRVAAHRCNPRCSVTSRRGDYPEQVERSMVMPKQPV